MSRAAVVPWKRGTAEFFIIFAGITLSLVADDWRQARGEKAREGVLLSALEEELLADSVDLAEVLSSRARTESLSISLLKSLHSPERPSEAAAVVSNLLFGRIPQPVNATYVGIINGGELSLIRDDHLRGLIVDYYEVQQPYIAEFWLWYKGFYLDWIDAVKRHYEFSLA